MAIALRSSMRHVELRDGAKLLIRPITPRDAAALSDAWSRSSEESRRRRLHGSMARLNPAELRYFTDVDHHRHEAMVAIDTESGRVVGVMRYIRDPNRPEEAELAALVVDDWQRRGVGAALLRALSRRATAEGVRRYLAIVSPDNTAAVGALTRLGAERRAGDDQAFVLSTTAPVRSRMRRSHPRPQPAARRPPLPPSPSPSEARDAPPLPHL